MINVFIGCGCLFWSLVLNSRTMDTYSPAIF